MKRPPEKQISAMHAKLAESGLTKKSTVTTLGYQQLSPTETSKLVGVRSTSILIPYFDPHGSPATSYRIRFLDKVLNKKGKVWKYTQPKEQPPSIYLPPIIGWAPILADPTQPLIITEGEFKAACATLKGQPTIGLGGVWNFRAGGCRTDLLDELEAIEWDGRQVYIVYDSDVTTNAGVALAEAQLRKALVSRGAKVSCVRIPPNGEDKQGLDDFIMAGGDLSEILLATVEDALSAGMARISSEVVLLKSLSKYLKLDTGDLVSLYDLEKAQYANLKYMEMVGSGEKARYKESQVFAAWNSSPHRPTLNRMVFEPEQPLVTENGDYNLFRGLEVMPTSGDASIFTDLVHRAVNDPVVEGHILDWFAHILQNPSSKNSTILLLYGHKEGTGKNLILDFMLGILGCYSRTLTDEDLESSFNAHYATSILVVFDEIGSMIDRRRASAKLKVLATSPTIQRNAKGHQQVQVANHLNIAATSNEDVPIDMGPDNRRVFAVRFDEPPLDPDYAKRVSVYLNGPGGLGKFSGVGLGEVYHLLLSRDIAHYDPNARAYRTEAFDELVEYSRSNVEDFAHRLVNEPETTLSLHGVQIRHTYVTTAELLAVYEAQQSRPSGLTSIGLAKKLTRCGLAKAHGGAPIKTGKGAQRLWCMPGADKALEPSEIATIYNSERGIKAVEETTKVVSIRRKRP